MPGRERVGEARSKKKKFIKKRVKKKKDTGRTDSTNQKRCHKDKSVARSFVFISFEYKPRSLWPLPVSAVNRLEQLQHKCFGLKTVSLLDLKLKFPKQFLYFGVKRL